MLSVYGNQIANMYTVLYQVILLFKTELTFVGCVSESAILRVS